MNAKVEITQEDEFQLAPSLNDFEVDDVEIRNGVVEFNLIYKFDSDYYVTLICNTKNETSEYWYQPNGSIDPQDEQCCEYEYPVTTGFAVVSGYHCVMVRNTQLILLTPDQNTKLNDWMHELAYEQVPQKMIDARNDHLESLAEARAEAMWEDA